ncbi:MAG: hypothetical protein AAGE94_12665 [Acidobacteriota bacterium]
MKKTLVSAFAAAFALALVVGFTVAPAPDAQAKAPWDTTLPAVQCWDAHLTVDTNNDGTWNLGWNQATGPSYSTCLGVLGDMINHANNQGWTWTNAHCYSYTAYGQCPLSAMF